MTAAVKTAAKMEDGVTHCDDVNNKGRTVGRVAALLAFALGAFGTASVAEAQTTSAQIDLNQFRPAPIARDGFAVSSANDQGHKRFGIQLFADYADDPLVFENNLGTAGSESAQVVHQQLTGHMNMSLGLWNHLVLYVGLPYHFIVKQDKGDTLPLSVPAPTGSGLGDAYAGLRLRLFGTRDDVFQLAVQGTLNVNTASLADGTQTYLGGLDHKPYIGGHPELLFTFNGGKRFHLNGNVGMRFRQNVQLSNLQLGDELTFGLGAIIELVDERLDLILEGFGRTGLTDSLGSTGFGKREESPIEALGGLKYHHPKGLSLGAGGGLGVQRGYGAPDYRVFATLGYTMPEKDKAPPPPADRDGDGINDDLDQCPDEAEDIDTFEDENGCPDPDNDNDGVLDVNDGAPMDPEDPDGFQDEDGVPDPDNDGDGILDVDDQCPNEAGTAANNGCRIRIVTKTACRSHRQLSGRTRHGREQGL
ncbi:MAG: transporter [Polyangiales bacterium]